LALRWADQKVGKMAEKMDALKVDKMAVPLECKRAEEKVGL
jgi:hypothetical protein